MVQRRITRQLCLCHTIVSSPLEICHITCVGFYTPLFHLWSHAMLISKSSPGTAYASNSSTEEVWQASNVSSFFSLFFWQWSKHVFFSLAVVEMLFTVCLCFCLQICCLAVDLFTRLACLHIPVYWPWSCDIVVVKCQRCEWIGSKSIIWSVTN